MKLKNKQTKIKTLLSLVIAFILITFLAPQMFLANTPRINPLFVYKLKTVPSYIAGIPGKMIASVGNIFSNNEGPSDNIKNEESRAMVMKMMPNATPIPVSKGEADMFVNGLKSIAPPANASFKPISNGVSVADGQEQGRKILKFEKGTKVEFMKFKLPDGREIKVLVIPSQSP